MCEELNTLAVSPVLSKGLLVNSIVAPHQQRFASLCNTHHRKIMLKLVICTECLHVTWRGAHRRQFLLLLASLSCLFKKKQTHLSGAMTTHCHASPFKKGKTWIISSFML